MFGKIAGFEFRYQLRQPVFWVVGILFFLLFFALMAAEQFHLSSGGNIHKNAPTAVAMMHMVGAMFFMFVTTAFVANVVARDSDTGFGPIVQSTRITKFDYLYGRFLGAFLAASVCFLSVPLGTFVGSLAPWVDPETLGANHLADYAYGYFVMGLPGVFLTSAIFFALATVTRSMMWTYVGVVGFLIAWTTAAISLDRPEFRDTMAVVEPFGQAAFAQATRYWTAAEQNAAAPALEGFLLWNRLLWTGIGFSMLALAYVLFRFETKGAKAKKAEKLKRMTEAKAEAPAAAGPLPKPRFGAATGLAQLRTRTKLEMGQVFKSPAFFVLLALGLFNSIGGLWFADEMYGSQIRPVTSTVIQTLNGTFSLIPMIIAIYYAGELVWRERDRRTHEIIDATALPDWAFVAPKTLAIALVLASTLLISVVAGVLVQAMKGYANFELGKYLLWYVLPQAIDFTLLAVLAVFMQTVAPHKFVGWGLMLLFIIWGFASGSLGLDHNLYNYAGGPRVPLSDMNGQGDFWKGAAWFRAYWSAFALLLLVISYGLWRRGTETRMWPRLRRLPRRLSGPAGALAVLAVLVFVGTGAYIFVNTNVWNEYRNNKDEDRYLADYEKALLPFEKTPQPNVVSVKLDLDLHPHEPRLHALGGYVLENRTDKPLDAVHLRFDRDVKIKRLAMAGAREEKTKYERFNYRILKFDRPLQPGEFRTLVFETELSQRGFKNRGNTTRLVDNGTFVSNAEFAPQVGMNRNGMLQDRAKRRKYGLPPELRPAKLEDASAYGRNYIGADWVNADITVTTDADQTPIAPGYKISDVTKGERRTARFRTEAPILHFFSVQSARYEVKSETYKGVELAVYYDRQHPWNVDRMISSLKSGLDYYQAEFGPYQFRQARIIEFPGYADFAQAFANTMPYSEGIGFVADFRDPEKIDYVTYVTAHELGHQWWAHQIIGADVQGSTSLSETLAQYSALMVMEKTYGPDKIRKFLKYELDNYLRSRGGDVIGEMPLMRVENQGYVHYRKGSLVMYLLKDEIGEEAVNRALRNLLQKHAFKGAPYPTSKDLVAALRAEAGPEHQQLITDLFEKITLYDLKAKDLKSKKRADGKWDVTVTVEARKLYADAKGAETAAPILGESFDLGLFTAEPGKKDFDKSDVILFERRPVKSGRQTFTFTVDKAPTWAGVDPYNKRIDRNSDDNLTKAGA
ncbi:M1 family aminopeptidase [Caulobacter sp. 17J80-11]|uniref:ABC transporter permease/M1 family aminopeptidase n=1 Tax=Caulobacter sp. 17J80-11 TaxID=2763502 RepID=UPI001653BD47|nr:M1 family aminopeptidase [Caulobacter sp. 17J80-11]MBC6982463.1 aminopeptidase [Caulobacter sp. 17J80-11]